ncbi:MAG: FtsX-like permease family protein [Luteitalea sp.]|nr:FtsX-like permease family protein [Luteitalea sp.]
MSDWKREIRARLQEAGLDTAHEAAVVDELADHLQDRYEELRARGLEHAGALDAVLTELNDRDLLARLRQIRRAAHEPPPAGAPATANLLADLWRDARYAVRTLRRAPGFTAIVVLTLAFGIGANTTVFTVINTLFLSPLPVANGSELVMVRTVDTSPDADADNLLPLSHLNLRDLRDRQTSFRNLAAYSAPQTATWLNQGSPERLFMELVTGDYFETLGLRPVIGRFFRPEEDRVPGTHPVAVIGHGPWQHRFDGAPDIVGRAITINGVAFTIIGVAPEGFKGIDGVFGPDVWIPTMMAEQVVSADKRHWLRDRSALAFSGVARLEPGIIPSRANAESRTIALSLEREYPDANRGRSIDVRPLTRAALGGSGQQSALMSGAVLMAIPALVLLIACSNVANLLLARAVGRRREIAVRLALGARRSRLLRQLLTESMLLSVTSGAIGLGLGYLGCQLLWSFRPPAYAQNLVDLDMDMSVLLFTLIASIVTGVIFGAVPAVRSSRPDIVSAVKEETHGGSRPRRGVGLADLLLVGQVALSLISLVTAGLLLRSIQQAYTIDPGFETFELGVAMLSPGQAGYDRPRSEQFYRDVRARVATIPGVRSVAWATNLPLFNRSAQRVVIEGREDRGKASQILTVVNTIDPHYLTTTEVALTRGRAFTDRDREDTAPIAIINDTLAAQHWPNDDPLGKRIRLNDDPTLRQIIGVVETVTYGSLGEAPQPAVYLPLLQNFSDAMVLHVATNGDPSGVMTTVQREIRQVDNQVEVSDVRTGRKMIGQALFGATMGVGLLGVFGLLALGLASLGLYGVMMSIVNLRQREIGVRMALGASRGDVLRLMLRRGMARVMVGVLVGLAASALVGRAISRLLYDVHPADPLSMAGASLVLITVAVVACFLPAYRASRLDPLRALREA